MALSMPGKKRLAGLAVEGIFPGERFASVVECRAKRPGVLAQFFHHGGRGLCSDLFHEPNQCTTHDDAVRVILQCENVFGLADAKSHAEWQRGLGSQPGELIGEG
jgi:hypothetical protein